MKQKSLIIACSIILGISQQSVGQNRTMAGSMHDFTMLNNTWNFSDKITDELEEHICFLCHVLQHNEFGDSLKTKYNDTSALLSAIWNHKLSNANYKIYAEGYHFWREGAMTIGNPDGSSKLCLSCHDGTVALANFRMFLSRPKIINGDINALNLGTDLSTSHPISFTYDASLAMRDRKIWDPSTAPSGVRGGTIDADMLEEHKLQCISCHDPHNSTSMNHLLIKDDFESALCLTCHRL